MASFTDQIPQFNPYIQQLPVEAMVKVGMEKQKRYDDGIQKIQTNIDNIAGLDVIRDVDKAYLQSKLNELGSNLRTVAAGDFSNFQLVNSVSGMANQISKDGTVQNAVNSTAWYRKEIAAIEKARGEGKSSIQNQWDFNQKANSWLTSSDPNQQFRDTYTPYTDVKKKWFDVLKGLHSDLREEDIPYEKNEDGSINYQKTAAAMTRISKEIVSADKIETAIRASLTPDELNQLSIDGRYEFRGYDTPEKLSVYSNTRYNSQINLNNKRIDELQGIANMSTSDPKKQKAALDIIEQLKVSNANITKSLNDELQFIKNDPDAAKAYIYKNGAILQFASGNAWEHDKRNVLANPVLEAEHWEKKFALDQSQFNLSVRSQNWKETKDKFDMDMTNKDYAMKMEKQMAELYGVSGGFSTYMGESTVVKDPKTAILSDVTNLEKSANSGITEVASGIGARVDQIEEAIALYTKADPKSVQNANAIIPVEWRDKVNEIIESRSKAKRLFSGLANIEEGVRNSERFKGEVAKLDAEASTIPGITVTGPDGRPLTFSGKEVFDYLAKEKTVNLGQGGAYSDINTDALSPKERVLYNSVKNRYSPTTQTPSLFGLFASKDPTQKKIEDAFSRFNAIKSKYGQLQGDIYNETSSQLLSKTGKYIPTLETITFGSGDGNIARRTWEGIASSVLSRFDEDISGTKGGSDKMLSASTVRNWLGEDKREKIIYKTLTQGDNKFLVMMLGDEEAIIPLTPQETGQLPVTSKNAPSPAYRDVVEAQSLGNGSTNPTGKFEDSYFPRYKIPGTTFNVAADLKQNASNSSKQYVNLQLNTSIGIIPLKIDDYPMDRENGMKFIQGLTNEKIKQLYLNSTSIPDEWKEIIRNMK